MNTMNLPDNVKKIIQILTDHGYEAYAVGGCVRDSILGRTPDDWDITTSAAPAQVKGLFSHTIDTGIAHGTVTVMMEHMGYEVTTYRIDGEYEDARHPREVTFTARLTEDLKRRDFTVNAMAYNDGQGLIDVFGGVKDLENKIIRCVGSPTERFSEDALRMLRAVRFSAQLGFAIAEDTGDAVRQLAGNIEKISAERIREELLKLLISPHPEALRTVFELGLTKVFLPEFDRMMETPQNSKHHMYSVGEHTLCALTQTPPDPRLRLAVLLHDVAKPVCRTTDAEGKDHFHGHPKEGALMARRILKRLKFDNDTTDMVCRLVLYHDDRPEANERNLRRALNRIGEDAMPLLLTVKRADLLAQSAYRRKEKMSYLAFYEKIYKKVLAEKQCFRKSDMAVGGRDLIAMGMCPGKELGAVLDALFEEVLDHPEYNTKEKLMELAHKLYTPFI